MHKRCEIRSMHEIPTTTEQRIFLPKLQSSPRRNDNILTQASQWNNSKIKSIAIVVTLSCYKIYKSKDCIYLIELSFIRMMYHGKKDIPFIQNNLRMINLFYFYLFLQYHNNLKIHPCFLLNNIIHITHTCIVLRKLLLIYIRMITINIQRSLATPHNFMPALIPFLSIQHLKKFTS